MDKKKMKDLNSVSVCERERLIEILKGVKSNRKKEKSSVNSKGS